MPGLVPSRVVLRRGGVVLQDGRNGLLVDPLEVLLPLAQPQVTPGGKKERGFRLF